MSNGEQNFISIAFELRKARKVDAPNTDLVRLLEHQRSNSFNLYILNNSEGERKPSRSSSPGG